MTAWARPIPIAVAFMRRSRIAMRWVAAFHRRCDPALALVERVNALLTEPEGARDWPLRFYSRERLFSVEARRAVILPDLAALPS